MAKPTSQWACIAILALMGSTFTIAHMARPPTRSAGLHETQMDINGEPETNNFQASDPAGKPAQHYHSQIDETEASAIGCSCSAGGGRQDKGIYGGGQGSGGTTIRLPNIFPFPGFPFGGFAPVVTTWGEGGGYGGAGDKQGCAHSKFPMHYVITPVYFNPMDPASRRDGPGDMAPSPSHN